jgi:hypothetical protein
VTFAPVGRNMLESIALEERVQEELAAHKPSLALYGPFDPHTIMKIAEYIICNKAEGKVQIEIGTGISFYYIDRNYCTACCIVYSLDSTRFYISESTHVLDVSEYIGNWDMSSHLTEEDFLANRIPVPGDKVIFTDVDTNKLVTCILIGYRKYLPHTAKGVESALCYSITSASFSFRRFTDITVTSGAREFKFKYKDKVDAWESIQADNLASAIVSLVARYDTLNAYTTFSHTPFESTHYIRDKYEQFIELSRVSKEAVFLEQRLKELRESDRISFSEVKRNVNFKQAGIRSRG